MGKHKHKWVLVYRDGPTDINDWKCEICGEMRSTRGPSEWRLPPEED